jgi:internalin A
MWGVAVTHAGMKEIAKFHNLETLSLYQAGVDDEGIKHLASLKQLRSLLNVGSDVTDDGLAELQNALPALTISR